MLNTLQAVVDAHDEARPLLPPGGRLVFVWSVRTRDEAEPFAQVLCGITAKARRCSAPVELRLFETRPGKAPPPTETAAVGGHVQSESLRQPLLSHSVESGAVDHADARGALQELHFEPGRPKNERIIECDETVGESTSDVAVYTCGPGPLVDGVVALCKGRGFTCHTETFLF